MLRHVLLVSVGEFFLLAVDLTEHVGAFFICDYALDRQLVRSDGQTLSTLVVQC